MHVNSGICWHKDVKLEKDLCVLPFFLLEKPGMDFWSQALNGWKHQRCSMCFVHRKAILPQNTAVRTTTSTYWCRRECGMVLCNPYAKSKRDAWCSSRRANQPGVHFSIIYPAFHPGTVWADTSISFYATDVKTWLSINSLQLSSLTNVPCHYSTLSCNLLLPSHHKTQKLVGLFGFFLAACLFPLASVLHIFSKQAAGFLRSFSDFSEVT